MKPIKHLIITSILAASLAGCTTYQHDQSRRSKIAQFIINHPVAARTIGVEDYKSVNISSNAARLAKRTGLDNKANGEGRGTQVNAVRHTATPANGAPARSGAPLTAVAGGNAETGVPTDAKSIPRAGSDARRFAARGRTRARVVVLGLAWSY